MERAYCLAARVCWIGTRCVAALMKSRQDEGPAPAPHGRAGLAGGMRPTALRRPRQLVRDCLGYDPQPALSRGWGLSPGCRGAGPRATAGDGVRGRAVGGAARRLAGARPAVRAGRAFLPPCPPASSSNIVPANNVHLSREICRFASAARIAGEADLSICRFRIRDFRFGNLARLYNSPNAQRIPDRPGRSDAATAPRWWTSRGLVQQSLPADMVRGYVIVYVPHTTAGITIQENADPDVKHDLLASSRRWCRTASRTTSTPRGTATAT